MEQCTASAFILFMSILNQTILKNDAVFGNSERIRPVEIPQDVYDFVVVGSGAGGSVVASRLSENPDWKVLLLEAGGDEPASMKIPALYPMGFMESEINWKYKTVNESKACLSTNGSCVWDSAKMLGGCTSSNAMKYNRGNPADYNRWAAFGNKGWTWDDVLPYFLKFEDNREIARVGKKYHATGGLLPVERFPYRPPFTKVIQDAAEELGYDIVEELNGDQLAGFTETQTSSKNGVRYSAASAFLRPVRNRPNLHVSLNSLVTKVIIENDIAVGVQYYKNGEMKTVRVNKEVILSAGNKRSPYILLHSGLGPKEQLESFGIQVVKDLPGVGENLQDHVAYSMIFTIDEPNTYESTLNVTEEYSRNQTGPLSALGLPNIARLATSKATPDDPDIFMILSGYQVNCGPSGIGSVSNSRKRNIEFRFSYLRPKSRGKISLASDNPLDYPIIWANYFDDPSDLETLLESVQIAADFVNSKTLKAYNITWSDQPYEKCSGYNTSSVDYWRCFITHKNPTDLHDAGTCKMGPKSDPMAVVDPQLRVHGIGGLRVADASIMPQIVSGNPAVPIMMIGERAADFIKNYHI